MFGTKKEFSWEQFKKHPTEEMRNEIIVKHAQLVKIVAQRLYVTLDTSVCELEDLYSYGIFGLIDAIDKYDPSKEIKFETYATIRIRGEIIDSVRKLSLKPRVSMDRIKILEKAKAEFRMEYGRNPSVEELSEITGIEKEKVNIALIHGLRIVSADEINSDGFTVTDTLEDIRFKTPEQTVDENDLKEKLQESLNVLTEKERNVILMIYYEEMTQREVGEVMGVSESRVSQLHTKALKKMKEPMGEYMGMLRL